MASSIVRSTANIQPGLAGFRAGEVAEFAPERVTDRDSLPTFDRSACNARPTALAAWQRMNVFDGRDFRHERHDFKQSFVLSAGLSCRRTQTSDHWARLR